MHRIVRLGWRGLLAVLLVVLLLPGVAPELAAREPLPAVAEGDRIAQADLPPQAQAVLQRIRQGGPFPFEKDGTVFFNRERLLPPQKRGYYREYTVPTPGVPGRGARRIVCGGWTPTEPDACYYTADHYASFRRIVP